MLKIIAGMILIIWLVGLFAHVAGSLVHLLLAIALVVFVYDLLIGRRNA